jgi:hypothetical protein
MAWTIAQQGDPVDVLQRPLISAFGTYRFINSSLSRDTSSNDPFFEMLLRCPQTVPSSNPGRNRSPLSKEAEPTCQQSNVLQDNT